jgi:soluble lytic murein transglycosylase-like protein
MDDKARAKLRKATQDFESLFVAQMLRSMRGTVEQGGMFGEEEGFGGDMLQGLFDAEISRQMSRGSKLGLGEMLYREITGESLPHSARDAAAQTVPKKPVQSADAPVVPAAAASGPAARPAVPPRLRIGHAVAERVNTYAPIIREASEKHGVDENLLKAVIATESAGDPAARSPKQAKGLMQLIDSTASDMGVRNVWNPRENIFGGARYLESLLSRFAGNVEKALASYNAGPGAVEKHGGIPPFRETQAYVGRVLRYLRVFEQQETPDHDQD